MPPPRTAGFSAARRVVQVGAVGRLLRRPTAPPALPHRQPARQPGAAHHGGRHNRRGHPRIGESVISLPCIGPEPVNRIRAPVKERGSYTFLRRYRLVRVAGAGPVRSARVSPAPAGGAGPRFMGPPNPPPPPPPKAPPPGPP